jgi:hypothetical protein
MTLQAIYQRALDIEQELHSAQAFSNFSRTIAKQEETLINESKKLLDKLDLNNGEKNKDEMQPFLNEIAKALSKLKAKSDTFSEDDIFSMNSRTRDDHIQKLVGQYQAVMTSSHDYRDVGINLYINYASDVELLKGTVDMLIKKGVSIDILATQKIGDEGKEQIGLVLNSKDYQEVDVVLKKLGHTSRHVDTRRDYFIPPFFDRTIDLEQARTEFNNDMSDEKQSDWEMENAMALSGFFRLEIMTHPKIDGNEVLKDAITKSLQATRLYSKKSDQVNGYMPTTWCYGDEEKSLLGINNENITIERALKLADIKNAPQQIEQQKRQSKKP